jgi:2-hydroxychromene-2-carboxylate isomerase
VRTQAYLLRAAPVSASFLPKRRWKWGMGTVISLADRRRTSRRAGAGRPRACFFFDLSDPRTYLAAERVERLPAAVAWHPALAPSLPRAAPSVVAARAAALRLPLVWPDRPAAGALPAMRAAAFAAEEGRAAAFVLAASRLAFCGGFDLDDPEIVAEAAAAAGVTLDGCLAAACDDRRDASIHAAGRFLVAHGADAMPVVQVGRTLYAGEDRLLAAAGALRGDGLGRRQAASID